MCETESCNLKLYWQVSPHLAENPVHICLHGIVEAIFELAEKRAGQKHQTSEEALVATERCGTADCGANLLYPRFKTHLQQPHRESEKAGETGFRPAIWLSQIESNQSFLGLQWFRYGLHLSFVLQAYSGLLGSPRLYRSRASDREGLSWKHSVALTFLRTHDAG